jgi:hypothetical protein
LTAAALERLPAGRRAEVGALAEALGTLAGVVAVGLGGSWARGDARPDSDVDLALYYRERAPLDVGGVRAVAARFQEGGAPVVTGLYEWGPWVNGGAWLRTRGGKLDLLYRNADQVERTIAAAERGDFEVHLAETACCRALVDPTGLLAGLRQRVQRYPPALRSAIVSASLWSAEFTLWNARGLAARGDVYGTAGCATRVASALVQALFAWNEVYFASDKTALAALDRLPRRPERFAARLERVLAAPGATPDALGASLDVLEALLAESVALTGGAYAPRYRL